MSTQTDPEFLRQEAYRDEQDLQTRIRIQQAYRSNPHNWFHWLYDKLDLPPGSLVLELGSGPGDLWRENLPRLRQGWQVLVTDFSLGMVRAAREALAGQPAFAYAAADTLQLPWPAQQFTGVIGNGLLDHLPSRQQALREIVRVLKPGGCFYTATGGRTHLQEIEALVQPFLPQAGYGGAADRFGLENGQEILGGWFRQVDLHRYPDELIFDQPEPVLEYIFSEPSVRQGLDGAARAGLEHAIRQRLAQERLVVRIEKGFFVAC